jgi:endonuclease YncB( thermonuclease family)
VRALGADFPLPCIAHAERQKERQMGERRIMKGLRSVIGAAILVLCASIQARGERLIGEVIEVEDGDTIVVVDDADREYVVQLQVIDAPQLNRPFSVKSWKNLADMVLEKTVEVQWAHLDKFDRLVGKVIVDGRDVGLEQVKAGLAWHSKPFQDWQSPEDRALYAQAENEARNGKVGLWKDATIKPPWMVRRASALRNRR